MDSHTNYKTKFLFSHFDAWRAKLFNFTVLCMFLPFTVLHIKSQFKLPLWLHLISHTIILPSLAPVAKTFLSPGRNDADLRLLLCCLNTASLHPLLTSHNAAVWSPDAVSTHGSVSVHFRSNIALLWADHSVTWEKQAWYKKDENAQKEGKNHFPPIAPTFVHKW